jgi:ABC-type lipoprotein release transport system permease subunit
MILSLFFRDLRIGARVLLREKSFCLLAVTVLALGICGVTTMFSVVNGTMLRGFSYPNANRLAGIQVIDVTQKNANSNGFGGQIFTLDYEAMRDQQKSFDMLAAYINGATVNLTVDGNPKRYTGAYVSSDFFRILGVAPFVGRDFAARDDRAGAEKFALISHELWQRDFALDDSDSKLPVAIVNSAFARRHFGNESAVGRRFRTVGNNGQLFGPWRTIVGVSTTVRMLGPFNNPQVDNTGFYVPFFSTVTGPVQAGPITQQFATVLVRPRGGGELGRRAAALSTALQRDVNQIDPNLPLYFVGTARENQESFLGVSRITATMFSLFGLVAVVLASVGLYGVMSFSVNQRTQEFGIRMALGAEHGRILNMVLGQGALQLAIGLAIGLCGTAMIGIVARDGIAKQLFDISPLDPVTYTAVAILLSAVAFVATFMPARRATRIDPIIALRAE